MSDPVAPPEPTTGCRYLRGNERVVPGPAPPGVYLLLSEVGGKDNV